MPDQDPADLARQIAEELDRRRTVDERTHADHHDYIRACIARDQRRDEIIMNLKKNVVVWVVIGGLVGLWQLFAHWWHSNGGPTSG